MKDLDTLIKPYITGFLPSLEGKDEIISRVVGNLHYFLNDMEEDLEKKLRLLLNLLNTLAFIKKFKSIDKFCYEEKEEFFNFIFNFPLKMIVAGFTGLKSLIMLSYYSLEDSWESIGYDGPIVNRKLK